MVSKSISTWLKSGLIGLGLIAPMNAAAQTDMLADAALTAAPIAACQTLTALWDSAAMIRTLETARDGRGPNNRVSAASRAALLRNINAVSLDTLTGASGDLETEVNRRALGRYKAQLTAALSSGSETINLTSFLSPDLFARLQNLETRLGCMPQDPQRQEVLSKAAAASFSGANSPASLSGEAGLSQRSGGLSRGTLSSGPSVESALTARDVAAVGLMLLILLGLPYALYRRRNSAEFKAREARHLLSQTIDARMDGKPLRLQLVDLSMNGFKLGHDGQIEETGKIEIGLKDGANILTWHDAHIRWRNDGFVGGNFASPLDKATLNQTVKQRGNAGPVDAAEAV